MNLKTLHSLMPDPGTGVRRLQRWLPIRSHAIKPDDHHVKSWWHLSYEDVNASISWDLCSALLIEWWWHVWDQFQTPCYSGETRPRRRGPIFSLSSNLYQSVENESLPFGPQSLTFVSSFIQSMEQVWIRTSAENFHTNLLLERGDDLMLNNLEAEGC